MSAVELPPQAQLALLAGAVPATVSQDNVSVKSPFTTRLQLLHGLSGVRVNWDKSTGPKPDEGNFWAGPPGGAFLGQSFKCIPLACRDHALHTKGNDVMGESFKCPPVGVLPRDKEEQVFQEIRRLEEDLRRNKQQGIAARVGKDVLLWIMKQPQADPRWPGFSSAGSFAIYFLAGTAVPEAKNFAVFFGKACTVKVAPVKSKNFTWYVPEVDLENGGICDRLDLPNLDEAKEEITKFLNPISAAASAEPADGVDGRPR